MHQPRARLRVLSARCLRCLLLPPASAPLPFYTTWLGADAGSSFTRRGKPMNPTRMRVSPKAALYLLYETKLYTHSPGRQEDDVALACCICILPPCRLRVHSPQPNVNWLRSFHVVERSGWGGAAHNPRCCILSADGCGEVKRGPDGAYCTLLLVPAVHGARLARKPMSTMPNYGGP